MPAHSAPTTTTTADRPRRPPSARPRYGGRLRRGDGPPESDGHGRDIRRGYGTRGPVLRRGAERGCTVYSPRRLKVFKGQLSKFKAGQALLVALGWWQLVVVMAHRTPRDPQGHSGLRYE